MQGHCLFNDQIEENLMIGMFRTTATVMLMLGLNATTMAWTQDIDKLKDVNTICEWKPESQCSWAVRIGANQPGVDMHGASMASMRLDQANLRGANLSGAILQLASMEAANLMLANLEGAHLHGVNFRGANLSLANLRNSNLLDADLSGADLRGANLNGAILIKTRFDNAMWIDGRRCGAESIGDCR
ncbi:MAG TPA: pentapeptide repeat-containing protein [Thiolapillus brandeum]|uniref:Pentapeptide repeat-containing protein n=1 Tax=Thiolapillus brandeum TaxID=1076588 RepID=A0A831JRC9_9GAMM|nr:pentapeptide repeat-containing protein [Thiolapillus brandeum]